jgi:hypothetical protein
VGIAEWLGAWPNGQATIKLLVLSPCPLFCEDLQEQFLAKAVVNFAVSSYHQWLDDINAFPRASCRMGFERLRLSVQLLRVFRV